MISSSKRSAVAAALVLSAGVLAGCGGDDDAEAGGESSATPAWESTPAGAAPTDAETPATDGGTEEPAAPGGAAESGEAPADPPAGGTEGDAAGAPDDGGTEGDAAGAPDDGGTGGEQPPPDAGDAEDPPAADPIAQPVDACTLGVEAIVGVLGANPTPEDTSEATEFGPGCSWTGSTGHELIVDISTFDEWVSAADMLGGDTEDIADLGTEAWASLSAPSNLQVAWRRDDVSVTLAASLDSGGDTLVDVARIIDGALLAAGY